MLVTVLGVLGVCLVLLLASALVREPEQLQPAVPDAADVVLPAAELTGDDVRALRFGLAPRGYRMREVDAALDRLAAELDRLRAELTQTQSGPRPMPPGQTVQDQPAHDRVLPPELDHAQPEEHRFAEAPARQHGLGPAGTSE